MPQNVLYLRVLTVAVWLLIALSVTMAMPASVQEQNSTVTIMPLGNSITYDNHSGDTRPIGLRTGYRQPLWLLLKDAGFNVYFVGSVEAGQDATPVFDPDNEGWPGWEDSQIANNVYSFLVNNPADVVLLHIGTNNLNSNPDDIENILNEIDRYESDYDIEVMVFLALIINQMSYNPTVTEFNDNVQSMAQTRIDNDGDKIIIVDMENGVGIDYQNDMYDNLHPNSQGYEKMAALWYAHINNFLWARGCPPGMTHYWKLDETTGWPYEDLIGDNNGTCAHCPMAIEGIVDGAQMFDGVYEEVNIANDSTFDWGPDASFSIEFWMKKELKSSGGRYDNEAVISRFNDGEGGLILWWVGVNCTMPNLGKIQFILQDHSGYSSVRSTTNVIDEDWHHVVAVRDGTAGKTRIYVDGVAEDSISVTYSDGFDASSGLKMGNFSHPSGQAYYGGAVDEVATYDRALTDTEILTHYNNTLAGLGYCEGDAETPTITSTPTTTAFVGQLYTYDVEATGNPEPTYALTTSPANMTIDPLTGLIEWTPDSDDDVDVTVEASNSVGADTQNFTINVLEVPICPPGMTHYWKLDETEGQPYEDFYGTNDATCTNCPTAIEGIVEGAQQFDGDDDELDVADDGTFDWAADASFSIEFWMKKETECSGPTSEANEVILSRYDGVPYWWIGVNCDISEPCGQNRIRFRLNDGSADASVFSTTYMIGEDWHQVVAVRDGAAGKTRLYVDGVAEDSISVTYSNGFAGSNPLNIGYYNSGVHYRYNGTLDELAMYDRALTDIEILTHYYGGLVGSGYCQVVTPTIVSTPVTTAFVGELYTYDVEAAGNPEPSYTLITSPPNMTIDPITGLIEWTPNVVVDADVTVEASNLIGIDTQDFTIKVAQLKSCPNTMTHYWKLNETEGQPYEDFYGTNDATCTNCPTAIEGIVEGAQQFDGEDDELDVADDGTFDWAADASFSIEFWMKKETECSGPTSAANEVILSRYDGVPYWWIGVNCDVSEPCGQNRIRFRLNDGSVDESVYSTTYVIGEDWHQVVAVRDGAAGKTRLYVDGVAEDSISVTYSNGFASSALVNIGYFNSAGHFRYNGIFDELAIYDKALTDTEILTHYNNGLIGLGYCFVCGDADGTGVVEISDAVFLINYVFVPGSPAPIPYESGDVDCSGVVEISDAVYIINYIFVPDSPAPCDPDGDGEPDC